jgi:hypothetical protein
VTQKVPEGAPGSPPPTSGAPGEPPSAADVRCGSPSAAGHLEPFGARLDLCLGAGSRPLEPRQFVTALLEDVAASCLEAGASVIGHLKCVLHTPDGVLVCNLTSARSGARCRESHREGEAPLPPLRTGDTAHLDLAVLVYGLSAASVGTLLRHALSRLLAPFGVSWSITA